MNDEFDDIDRALFALPLEEPPAGLRDAIMNVTLRAPRAAFRPQPITSWEAIFLGVCAAFAVWLTIGWLTDATIAHRLTDAFVSFGRIALTPSALAWLAAGVALAGCTSFASLRPVAVPLRRVRS